MDAIVACCGLVCSDCPAYMATQADDAAALERVAAQWREEYNSPDITVESVICDGCMVESERHCGHWYECDIRACGVERGVANCAHCSDYVCDRLESFFGFVPDARTVLDNIHRSV
jgi:hypothetical protein